MNRYERFFNSQQGGSSNFDNIGPIYRARYHRQTGSGLGSVFKTLWSLLSPHLLSAGRALGTEAIRSGTEALTDLGKKPLKRILREQGTKSVNNLLNQAEDKIKKIQRGGKGIKRTSQGVNDDISNLLIAKRGSKRRPVKRLNHSKNRSDSNTKRKIGRRITRKVQRSRDLFD
jgi:hypothetical protein